MPSLTRRFVFKFEVCHTLVSVKLDKYGATLSTLDMFTPDEWVCPSTGVVLTKSFYKKYFMTCHEILDLLTLMIS